MHDNRLPVISVVIPVYRAEKYIAQTLESVLAQPYRNIQIVCVDDGSPDDSVAIVQRYAQEHGNIHILRQKNAGVSAARNAGIEYALSQGDGYVAFLDADDCWAKNAVTPETVSLFQGMDCVGFVSADCAADLMRIKPIKKLEEQVVSGGADAVTCHNGHHFGAMVCAASLLRRYRIRFDVNLKYSEDLLFRFSCLYLADQIRLVDQPLYLYRDNPFGVMRARKHGIDYLPDIIDGWLRAGAFLKPYENETRKNTDFFFANPKLYALEMVANHYLMLRSKKELDAFFLKRPDLKEMILHLTDDELTEYHRVMFRQYTEDPEKFRRTYVKKGCIRKLRILLTDHKIFYPMRNKITYPDPNCYL